MVRWRGAGDDISIKALKAWPVSDIEYAVETDVSEDPLFIEDATVDLFRSTDYNMKTSDAFDSPGPFIVLFLSFQNPTRADVQLDFTVGIEVLPA